MLAATSRCGLKILLACEPYLPEAAEAAYIQMKNEERDMLYEASAYILVKKTLQLYALRITAEGSETENEIR